MFYRKIALIITFIFASYLPQLMAQGNSGLEKQALLLFSYDEFEMAKQLYDSLHRMDPYNPNYSMNLGVCYLNTSDLDLALKYFEIALAFSPDPGEIYYKIASTYDLKNIPDSAIYYFKKYNLDNTKSENAYNRIAIIYLDMEGGQDSALFYAQKAVSIEPKKPDGYYTLSMTYISLSRFEEAIYTALVGIKNNSEYALLNMPIGLGYFYQENYEKAAEYFEQGWKVSGLEEMFVDYLAYSMLLVNTKAEMIRKHNNEIKFTETNFQNIENILESTQNPQSEYYYPKMIRDFRADFNQFGLDDYAMFYIGFTQDEAYQPYENLLTNMNELWESKNYNLIKEYTESRLDSVPVDFPLYWPLAKIAALEGDFLSQLDNLIKYYGFSQAIAATGDGTSIENPYLITYIQHEYEIMYQLKIDITEEYLESTRSSNYDVFIGSDLTGMTRKIYFNIDLPFSSHLKNTGFAKKYKKRRKK